MRYLSWIVTVPVAVLAVLFAVSNRTAVTFGLWPLPFTIDAPLYLATLLALAIGFVCGGTVVWIGQHRHRRRARLLAKRTARLEQDMAEAAQARVEVPARGAGSGARLDAPGAPGAVQGGSGQALTAGTGTPPTIH